MKKIVILLIIILIPLSITGCGKKEVELTDAQKFKEEYEALNGKEDSSGKEHRTISIPEDNPFVYTAPEKIVKKIENNETFYVYFGSAYCPWCRSVIEKFIEVANKYDIDPVYYVDIWDGDHVEILRDTYILNEEGKPELVTEGTESYQKLLEYFDDLLNDYTLTNEKGKKVEVGEKRIFAPDFVYIEDGKATRITTGISENQKDAREKLNEVILGNEADMFREFFGIPTVPYDE